MISHLWRTAEDSLGIGQFRPVSLGINQMDAAPAAFAEFQLCKSFVYPALAFDHTKTLHPRLLLIKCLFYSNSGFWLRRNLYRMSSARKDSPWLKTQKKWCRLVALSMKNVPTFQCVTPWKTICLRRERSLIYRLIIIKQNQLTITSGRPWALKQTYRPSWACIWSWWLLGLLR